MTGRKDRDKMIIKRKFERGFTLIEIMVVLAMVAILMGLATYSVRGMFLSTRIDTEANRLFGLMLTTQSRAMSRGFFTLVRIIDENTVEAYEERTFGAYDPLQIITAGINLADFDMITRILIDSAHTGSSDRIKIDSIEVDGTALPFPGTPVNIAFSPFGGRVYVNNFDPAAIQNVVITLRAGSYGSNPSYILISPFQGRIFMR